MGEIVPTILTADFSDFIGKLASLKGICPRVGIDIIDGKFVNNQTISLETIKDQEVGMQIDLHLMVKEPEEWIFRAMEILPDRLIGQVEMMTDCQKFITETVEGGMRVGLALDLETPVEALSEELYHSVDMILILAARAGFSGQEFNPEALKKIKKVRKIVGVLVDIGVDCGLNQKTIPQAFSAGANIFYVTSHFWQAEDLSLRYNQLKSLVER